MCWRDGVTWYNSGNGKKNMLFIEYYLSVWKNEVLYNHANNYELVSCESLIINSSTSPAVLIGRIFSHREMSKGCKEKLEHNKFESQ